MESLPRRGRGAGALDVQRHRLFDFGARRQRVGPRQADWAHIGLERGVGPVALVFHLVGVARHAAGDPRAVGDGVGDRAQVHHRLVGLDFLRETGVPDVPIDFLYGGRRARNAVHRVQHHESGAVGGEIGFRRALGRETQVSVGAALDDRFKAEGLARVANRRAVGHAERLVRFLDRKIDDFRLIGAPHRIAGDERDGAHHLDPVQADVAQVAVLQFGRERPGAQDAHGRNRLFGAEQADGAGRDFGHGSDLRTLRSSRGCAN